MEKTQKIKAENHNYINLYIEAAWNLSYSAFWEELDFSFTEIETAREFIRLFISKGDDLYNNYLSYCQRVLMTYCYIKKENGKYVPLPSRWFDKSNDYGFKGTDKWMDALNLKRRAVPLYRIELKAVAEAVLEMSEDATIDNFRYWKTYLLERKQGVFYSLFISVVMNGMLNGNRLN